MMDTVDIFIINPGIVIQSKIKDKNGTIKEKSEEEADMVVCHLNGKTSLKHQFKNPKEMGNGDILTLSIKEKDQTAGFCSY